MSGRTTFIVGDVLERLAEIPASSVDLVLTSPPFLALRSYLPADHPDKALEGGSQSTPGEFVDWLLDVTEALDRVLAPHGSMCVELGDTYAGSGGAGGDYGEDGLREGQPKFRQVSTREHRPEREGTGADGGDRIVPVTGGSGWPADKSLTLIPETYRFALAYGHNPHTGRQTTPWRIRNVVRWVRPNPPVGALGDKYRPATSEMVVFCRTDEAGRKRYFDLDAVRKPLTERAERELATGYVSSGKTSKHNDATVLSSGLGSGVQNPAGTPPLDWWNISTQPYKGAHYATWPDALCVKPIKTMCPERVCTVCGEPSRRIVETTRDMGRKQGRHVGGEFGDSGATEYTTVGWSDCGHDSWRPGVVLDPFAGSGTTLAVATGHGRDGIGIDLDDRNVELARERIGPMFFEVVGLD